MTVAPPEHQVHDPVHITKTMLGLLDKLGHKDREEALKSLQSYHESLSNAEREQQSSADTGGSHPRHKR